MHWFYLWFWLYVNSELISMYQRHKWQPGGEKLNYSFQIQFIPMKSCGRQLSILFLPSYSISRRSLLNHVSHHSFAFINWYRWESVVNENNFSFHSTKKTQIWNLFHWQIRTRNIEFLYSILMWNLIFCWNCLVEMLTAIICILVLNCISMRLMC